MLSTKKALLNARQREAVKASSDEGI